MNKYMQAVKYICNLPLYNNELISLDL